MDSVSLKVPVTIKAKLTEKLKARILEDLTESLNRVELELQQIDIQERRALEDFDSQTPSPHDIQQINAIHQHFGAERNKRLEYRDQSLKRKEDTEKLAIGAEIIQGTLERQVDVRVGDDMRELMNVEILVEDDKIIAIRS